MASYTPNYQLHQWEGSDSFLREDFNADFRKIDSALKEAKTGPSCVTGSYQGAGKEITLSLGFRPSFLVIIPVNRSDSYSTSILCLLGTREAMIKIPRYSSNGVYRNMVFSQTGVTIPTDSGMTGDGIQFSYAAFY